MENRKQTPASRIALGGMTAALTVVIMSMGGLIPVATYVCPVIGMIVLRIVLMLCGRKVAWAWYGAVSILTLLMSPDKEAGFVFLFLGFYPILKPWFDSRKLPLLWKAAFFNADVGILYWILLHLMGMAELQQEFGGMGRALILSLLALGNLTFFLLDMLLGGKRLRGKRNGG